jgi:ribosome-associated protein
MKLADLTDRGSDAKAELAAGAVTVNDDIETRRGRQLRPGDTVVVGGRSARVVRS